MTFVAARVKAGVVITCKCVFPAYAQYKEVYDMAVGAVAQMVERFKALGGRHDLALYNRIVRFIEKAAGGSTP